MNDAHLFIFVLAMCVFGSGECFGDVVAEVNQGVESFQEHVVGFCCFPILGCVGVQLKKNGMGGGSGGHTIYLYPNVHPLFRRVRYRVTTELDFGASQSNQALFKQKLPEW